MADSPDPVPDRRAQAAVVRMDGRRAEPRRQAITASVVRAVALGICLAALVSCGGTGSPSTTASPPAGIPASPATTAAGRTTAPPWPAPTDPAARVRAAGLPMLGEEGNVLHFHTHLDVLADGKPVVVPADIGIDLQTDQISPLHSHDTDGVIHVESPVKADFSLGQFMTEWGVALTQDSIGGLKAGNGNTLRAYINGKPYTGNPAAIILKEHDEIALVYGPTDQSTKVPSTYDWPPGE
ncbi:hypothetical protein [Streptomyces adustus]|uniref:hypothetical protein n=1 Tax=Streptomyces adustus TaxID=1609272 RepID=UPI00371A19BC